LFCGKGVQDFQFTTAFGGRIYYYGSLQICEQQSVFLLVTTLQRRKKGTNDFHNVIFVEVLVKIIGKKARTRFRPHTKLSSFQKIFPKHNLVRPLREHSILAVSIGKFGLLREPIRKHLFSPDQFSHYYGSYDVISIHVFIHFVLQFFSSLK